MEKIALVYNAIKAMRLKSKINALKPMRAKANSLSQKIYKMHEAKFRRVKMAHNALDKLKNQMPKYNEGTSYRDHVKRVQLFIKRINRIENRFLGKDRASEYFKKLKSMQEKRDSLDVGGKLFDLNKRLKRAKSAIPYEIAGTTAGLGAVGYGIHRRRRRRRMQGLQQNLSNRKI